MKFAQKTDKRRQSVVSEYALLLQLIQHERFPVFFVAVVVVVVVVTTLHSVNQRLVNYLFNQLAGRQIPIAAG